MRLQKLKQLGLCFKKFPGACHSRYEHSVGVAHLAGLFGLHLLGQAGECIGMTVLDVELLEVAGEWLVRRPQPVVLFSTAER